MNIMSLEQANCSFEWCFLAIVVKLILLFLHLFINKIWKSYLIGKLIAKLKICFFWLMNQNKFIKKFLIFLNNVEKLISFFLQL